MVMQRLTLCCLLFLLPALTHAKIVFKAGSHIYVMDDDGRNAKILVKRGDAQSVWWPVWSPDGKQVAFGKSLRVERGQPQKLALFIINSDGSNERRLTDDNEENLNGSRLFEGKCSWSPDGKHMVFTSPRLAKPGNAQNDAWRINIETKALKRLTRTVSLTTAVAWSPDGKYIAYRDDITGRTTIHLMRADGSGQHELVPGQANHFRRSPRWSVDSQSVVYYEWNGHSTKFVIHNIKNDKRRVVDAPDNWRLHSACFMGRKYLLISAKPPNTEKHDIYRYHLVTGEMVNLTNTPAVDDYGPDWIDDDVLSVTPQDKKKVTWGALKE